MLVIQRLVLRSVTGAAHTFRVTVTETECGVELLAEYEAGSLPLPCGTEMARWPVEIVLPAGSDTGHVWIGNGRIEISVPELRGLGLGSLFMSCLFAYIHKQPNLPVVPINLSADDAATLEERDRRNRFYERLGFTFDYQDDRKWGESRPILSHQLQSPDFVPRDGWVLQQL
jgi:GNAT superfamily N-acetyltransferase